MYKKCRHVVRNAHFVARKSVEPRRSRRTNGVWRWSWGRVVAVEVGGGKVEVEVGGMWRQFRVGCAWPQSVEFAESRRPRAGSKLVFADDRLEQHHNLIT